jgi:hypothetical protein
MLKNVLWPTSVTHTLAPFCGPWKFTSGTIIYDDSAQMKTHSEPPLYHSSLHYSLHSLWFLCSPLSLPFNDKSFAGYQQYFLEHKLQKHYHVLESNWRLIDVCLLSVEKTTFCFPVRISTFSVKNTAS